MGVAYYNNKRGISQYRGVLTRPAVGLNEYTPANALNENYMSDLKDVSDYRGEALSFLQKSVAIKKFETEGTNEGRIVGIFDSELSTTSTYTFYGMSVLTTGWNLFVAYYASGASTMTKYAMTIPSTPTYSAASLLRYSKTIFRTEADVFYCFASDNYTRLHYLKYNYAKTTNTYGYVDLPFYPASMVSHVNRIFAIDTKNKLWWCRAGDLFTWYGLEYDADMIMTSANMGNKTHSLTGTIDTPRVVTATCTTTDTADTRGILTITGTNSNGNAQTAVLTLYEGRVQTPEVFATVTSVVQSGWTQGGATPDTIEIGVGPVGTGFVQDDAGYWTLEGEPYVYELFTLSNVLYISAGVSIYAFRGYSYETFSLQRLVSNLGNPKNAVFGYRYVAVIRNNAYFIGGNDVYEFDGDSAPRIISRPVYVNNALTNGIMGGIDLISIYTMSNWVLESDEDHLYIYPKAYTPSIYYQFDFQTRTWWKYSGWRNSDLEITDSVANRLVPNFANNNYFIFHLKKGASGEDDFWFSLPNDDSETKSSISDPYVTTKSYQTNPSEVGTLTAIILQLKGGASRTASITVAYRISETSGAFTTLWEDTSYDFTGDMEIIEIPLVGSEIVNQHHYRLKITITDMSRNVTTAPVYLYNIERRFRVRGYSR